MSKFTLGQRQLPTLGLRSQQPKNYVGPTLSCYLGLLYINIFIAFAFDERVILDVLQFFNSR